MNGTKPEEIYKAICSQTVELIFTAHPTQVNRGHLWLYSAPPWLDEHPHVSWYEMVMKAVHHPGLGLLSAAQITKPQNATVATPVETDSFFDGRR